MKKMLAGMALLACLSPLQAAEQQFDWSFRYFGDYWGPDLVDQRIYGSFIVDDVNADGVFEQSELKGLYYGAVDYVTCAGCTIDRFTFTPNGAIDFKIAQVVENESGWYRTDVDVGRSYGYVFWASWGGEPSQGGGRWVDQTIATVTAVPEPQTYLMLGAGLLALLGAARKRRR